jgi:invasin B
MINELFGEVEIGKLKNRLAMLQAMAGAKQQGYEKLGADYQAAVDALAAAEEAVGGSQEKLEKLRERVQHFQGLLNDSEARLAGLDPESPEYAKELALRDLLKGDLANHTQTFEKATDAHLKLIERANAAAKTLQGVSVRVQEAGLGGPAIKEGQEKALSSSALALLNRLKIIELLGEAAQDKQELNQELFLELQASIQEHMKLESEKYLEEVRKAEALNKAMGCLGPILAAVMVIAGAVATLVTANPQFIIMAAIGVVVMLADMAVKEITGVSFMSEAMKPLTAVMQEAIKLFTELYTDLLIGLGVDEETAKEIAQIAGMIQGIASTLAAVALAAVVGVQVIGPIIGAVAAKLASVIAQAAPAAVQALRQVATSVGQTLTQLLTQLRSVITKGADAATLARYTANAEIAQAVVEFGGVAVQAGLGVASGNHQAKAAEHLADVRVRMAISEEITQYLTRVVEDYGTAMSQRTRQIEQVFADMQRSHSVSLQMVRHV